MLLGSLWNWNIETLVLGIIVDQNGIQSVLEESEWVQMRLVLSRMDNGYSWVSM